MSIKYNYHQKQKEVARDPEGELAAKLERDALDAVYQGVHSPAWVSVMEQFAESPVELDRLVGRDSTASDHISSVARAYIVANAATGLSRAVNIDTYLDRLDEGLD